MEFREDDQPFWKKDNWITIKQSTIEQTNRAHLVGGIIIGGIIFFLVGYVLGFVT